MGVFDNKDMQRQRDWDNLRADLSAKAEADRAQREQDPAFVERRAQLSANAIKSWQSKERNRRGK